MRTALPIDHWPFPETDLMSDDQGSLTIGLRAVNQFVWVLQILQRPILRARMWAKSRVIARRIGRPITDLAGSGGKSDRPENTTTRPGPKAGTSSPTRSGLAPLAPMASCPPSRLHRSNLERRSAMRSRSSKRRRRHSHRRQRHLCMRARDHLSFGQAPAQAASPAEIMKMRLLVEPQGPRAGGVASVGASHAPPLRRAPCPSGRAQPAPAGRARPARSSPRATTPASATPLPCRRSPAWSGAAS